MTPTIIRQLEEDFARFLDIFKGFFPSYKSFGHLGTFCRGLLSDLPQKCVEPIALHAGIPPRNLQFFLTDLPWRHEEIQQELRKRIAQRPIPQDDPFGPIALIDEQADPKCGDKTPGVQRQWCGHEGKIENCVVCVHLAWACGDFKCILESDLYLPQSWAGDLERRRAAHIPDTLAYQSKTQIAADQIRRARDAGVPLNWVLADEGYGKDPTFLRALDAMDQPYVLEVPKQFHAWGRPVTGRHTRTPTGRMREKLTYPKASRVEHLARWSKAIHREPNGSWQTVVVSQKTRADVEWDVRCGQIWLKDEHGAPQDRQHWLIYAVNRHTEEKKYFISNAPPEMPVERLVQLAFQRWKVEHVFRIAKSELGLDQYEGRSYVGLVRFMLIVSLCLLFLAEHTDCLRGKKKWQGPDVRAGGEGDGQAVQARVGADGRGRLGRARQPAHFIPPETQSSRDPEPAAAL